MKLLAAKHSNSNWPTYLPTAMFQYGRTNTAVMSYDIETKATTYTAGLSWAISFGDITYKAKINRAKKRAAKFKSIAEKRKIKTSMLKLWKKIKLLDDQFLISTTNVRKSILGLREVLDRETIVIGNINDTISFTDTFVESVISLGTVINNLIYLKSSAHIFMGTFWDEMNELTVNLSE